MINRILRWLRGYVIFEAVGKFPERLINLALINDITLVKPVGKKGMLTAQVSVDEYRQLCKIRKKAMLRLKVKKKTGFPFILYRNRKRKGLWAGAVLFGVLIYILSGFIWSIDINGNNAISIYEIQGDLRENGIYVGALKKNINVTDAERKLELKSGRIAWMSVNITGCRADVEISESQDMPEIVDKATPCNLKAKKTGQILKMNVKEGQKNAAVGDGVAKGQMLVSGIVDIGDTGTSLVVHSEGEIYAGVSEKEIIRVLKSRKFKDISELRQRRVIKFLNFKFPLDYAGIENVNSRRYVTDSIVLNDTNMPIDIITEYNFSAHQKDVFTSAEQAEKLAGIELALNDIFSRWESDIQQKTISMNESKESYDFTADYYCIEDIAEEAPIKVVYSE